MLLCTTASYDAFLTEIPIGSPDGSGFNQVRIVPVRSHVSITVPTVGLDLDSS